MMQRFARSRNGTVVIIFALSAMVLALVTAIVVNQVTSYMGKRRLQAAVDMTSMMMMRSSQVTQAHALSVVTQQIGQTQGVNVTVTRGRYTPSATVAAASRFVANAMPYNAVRVHASVPADKMMMSGMMPANLVVSASAIAARRQTVAMEVGSRLVRAEGGLSAALLDSLLGYNGKLTIMDYNSLAGANVDAVTFLQALNVKANINAVTFDDVLSAPVKVGDIVYVLAATSTDAGVSTLLAKASAGSSPVKLNEVINLGAIKGLPAGRARSGRHRAAEYR